MFESSHPFAFFDYFGVPHIVRPRLAIADGDRPAVPVHKIWMTGEADGVRRSLLWLGTDVGPTALPANCQLGCYRLWNFTFATL